jgi:hypothetical protein
MTDMISVNISERSLSIPNKTLKNEHNFKSQNSSLKKIMRSNNQSGLEPIVEKT